MYCALNIAFAKKETVHGARECIEQNNKAVDKLPLHGVNFHTFNCRLHTIYVNDWVILAYNPTSPGENTKK